MLTAFFYAKWGMRGCFALQIEFFYFTQAAYLEIVYKYWQKTYTIYGKAGFFFAKNCVFSPFVTPL